MDFKSKKTSLLILGLTAIVSSRAFFALINDPEGPNLLIVTVLAAILYFVSSKIASFVSSTAGLKKLLLAIGIQIIIVAVLYFFA